MVAWYIRYRWRLTCLGVGFLLVAIYIGVVATRWWNAGYPLRVGTPVIALADHPQQEFVGFADPVQLWDRASPQTVQPIPGAYAPFAWSPNGEFLAAAGLKDTVNIYRLVDKQVVLTIAAAPSRAAGLAWSRDGKLLAIEDGHGTVRLVHAHDGTAVRTLRSGKDSIVRQLAFSPDAALIAAAIGSEIFLWRVNDGTLAHVLRGVGVVKSLAISPDGQLIAAGGGTRELKLWRLEDGQLVHTLDGQSAHVNSVAFSPDGKWLAVGGGWPEPTWMPALTPVLLFQVDNGALHTIFRGHTQDVTSLSFNSTGEVLLSASFDGTIRQWTIP
jgi:WD40 repeat protein